MGILVKSIILIGIFWSFYKLVLQQSTFFQWNRIFLIIGILLSLGLPFLVIPVEILVDTANTTWQNSNVIAEKNLNVIEKSNWNIKQIIFGIYITGLIVILFKIVIQSFSLIKFVKNLPKRKVDQLIIHETDKPINAFSFFKIVVINSNKFSPEEQAHFLVHESIHAHQYHTLDILLAQLLILIQWFNPIAWWYKKSLETNLEYIADRDSQQIIGNGKEYQQLLLKTSVSNFKLNLTNNFNSSLIKNRIKMLHSSKSKPVQKWKFLLLLPILALFIYSFNRVEVKKFYISNPIDISFTITKESSDKDLQAIKEVFKSQDITFEMSQLKRNENNEITGLSIKVSSKDFNTNFNSESSLPIEPISITYNSKLKKVSIGNIPTPPSHMMYMDKKAEGAPLDKTIKWEESGDEKKVIIIKSDDTVASPKKVKYITVIANDSLKNNEIKFDIIEDDKENQNGTKVEKKHIIYINEEEKDTNKNKKEEKQYTIIVKQDEKGNVTYTVNGKEVSKEELDKIEADEIKEVNVIKKKEIKNTK